MGFEFQLVAVAGSSDTSWQKAGKCFATQVVPHVRGSVGVVRTDALNTAYELDALPWSSWREDFVIAQQEDVCYICFHRGTDHQMTSILGLLTTCCRMAGIAGTFEEL